MQDYLAPHELAVHTCAASGVKFFDLDANGRRDAGEPGIPDFLIWADYDNDGQRGVGEPFTETDDQGRYVLDDIRPPGGSYRLREGLLVRRRAIATSWVCSFPHAGTPGGFGDGPGGLFGCGWGAIASATTPHARDRDFGNWLPARLTVEKQLWPAGDPGRFDLNVNGVTVLPAAGDGATTTIAVPPGSYDITEAAVPPTNANDYRSTVTCRPTTRRRGRSRAGTGYAGPRAARRRSGDLHVHQRAGGRTRDRDREDRPDAGDRRRHAALQALRHQPRRREAAGRHRRRPRRHLRRATRACRQGRRQRQRHHPPDAGPGRHLDLRVREQDPRADRRLHADDRHQHRAGDRGGGGDHGERRRLRSPRC